MNPKDLDYLWKPYQPLLGPIWQRILAEPLFRPIAILLGVGLVLSLLGLILSAKAGAQSSSKTKAKEKQKKHIPSSGLEKFLAWAWPPNDPWIVGDIIVSFQWLTHCIVFGTTGSGKSTFVMQRILRRHQGLPGLIIRTIWRFNGHRGFRRQKRGLVAFAGNESKPFRKAFIQLMEEGYPSHIWTSDPTGKGFSLDVFEGPPSNVAQRINAMKPAGQGDTGLQSGAVEGMITDAIYEMDRRHVPRDFANLMKIIRTIGIRDLDENGEPDSEPRELTRQEATGLENWCTRLNTMRRRLGKSIGPDLRLSEALKRGEAVLIQASSYGQPAATEQLASMFVFYAMWLVSVIGNFDLIIDEPGAVDAKMFTRLLTATRAQGVKIMVCPQSLKQIEPELREMCTTALLLGAAGASHEAQELCSKMVHGEVEDVDFTLLNPKNWRDRLVFWRARRGLRSCQGYLLSNGRLDKVQTDPCDVSALTRGHKNYDPIRYPEGSVSRIIDARRRFETQDGPAPTRQEKGGPENEGESEEAVAEEVVWETTSPDSDFCDPDDAGSTFVAEDAVSGQDDGDVASSVSESDDVFHVVPPVQALGSKDGLRLWGKGKAEVSRTVENASVGKLPVGLDVPHRFWGTGGPVLKPTRPKDQCKGLSGEKKGIRGDVTVYRWWYELVSGKPISPMKPSMDHLCHTYDDSCPGSTKPCGIEGCDDPAHPEGYPCQHVRCYTFEHNQPVTVVENAKRQSEQRSRHQAWLAKHVKVAA